MVELRLTTRTPISLLSGFSPPRFKFWLCQVDGCVTSGNALTLSRSVFSYLKLDSVLTWILKRSDRRMKLKLSNPTHMEMVQACYLSSRPGNWTWEHCQWWLLKNKQQFITPLWLFYWGGKKKGEGRQREERRRRRKKRRRKREKEKERGRRRRRSLPKKLPLPHPIYKNQLETDQT